MDGKVHDGWTEFKYVSDMDNVANGFTLKLTNRWKADGTRYPIYAGMNCRLSIQDVQALDGYVDDVELDYGENSHSIEISGRDKSGDLVDCAVIDKASAWKNYSLYDLTRKICDGYGIPVNVQSDCQTLCDQKFGRVVVEPGEKGIEVIERHMRQRGVLLRADARGGLDYFRIGARRALVELTEGVNIKSIKTRASSVARYTFYRILAQQAGSQNVSGEAAVAVKGDASDLELAATLGRPRNLVVLAERGLTPAEARQRAKWEAAVRVGRAVTVEITVQGWEEVPGSGKLWAKGDIVTVWAPTAQVEADLIIAGVEMTLDENGANTTLKLVRPGAYDAAPEVVKKKVRTTAKGNKYAPVEIQ